MYNNVFIISYLFDYECITDDGGLNHPLKWVGYNYSRLGGVVLFNFAFSVTVPVWLQEKNSYVSVNKTIWGASSMATIVYFLLLF